VWRNRSLTNKKALVNGRFLFLIALLPVLKAGLAVDILPLAIDQSWKMPTVIGSAAMASFSPPTRCTR
jgi:hypothetical protein